MIIGQPLMRHLSNRWTIVRLVHCFLESDFILHDAHKTIAVTLFVTYPIKEKYPQFDRFEILDCSRPVGFQAEWSQGEPRTVQSYNCSPYPLHPDTSRALHQDNLGRPGFFPEASSEGVFQDSAANPPSYSGSTTSANTPFPAVLDTVNFESPENCHTFQRALSTSRSLSAAVAAVAAAYISSSTPAYFNPSVSPTTSALSVPPTFPISSMAKRGTREGSHDGNGIGSGTNQLKNFPFTYDRMHEFQAEVDEYNMGRMKIDLINRT